MKYTFFLLFVLFCVNTYSQPSIQFVDTIDNPICGLYSTVYKNGNQFADCGGTNSDGIKIIHIKEKDINAEYYLYLNSFQYEPIWQKIDIFRKDTLVFKLKQYPYYIPESKHLHFQNAPGYSGSFYQIKRPRKLEELPQNIVDKVSSYLTNRIGIENYKNLHFLSAQIFMLHTYNKIYPKHKITDSNYTAYYLTFSYRNIDAGIAKYAFLIEVDKEGNIRKDIKFPKTNKEIKLVNYNTIKETAKKNFHYLEDKTEIKIAFLQKENTLIWKFINETYNENYTFVRKTAIYNAHNGHFIRIEKSEGEWID